ncbi:hypothetical protein DY000_02003337 [Brassica cretica]|uniref:Uncharacterized protein n=1 Tax=Brassica cretica TaxID=69181 RepID=A0ABQ7BSI4_BRACR|nr:hypothetical protein DY000_02003337 [Brassica cretica]
MLLDLEMLIYTVPDGLDEDDDLMGEHMFDLQFLIYAITISVASLDKYQPRSAFGEDQQTQVSHVFFPEWLCQWHERGFQQRKDFLSSDEEQWKDADYNCSESLVQLR